MISSILLNHECDHIFPPLTRAVLRYNTGTEVNRLKYQSFSSLQWSTKSRRLSICQPFLLFSAAQISRSTVCVRLLRTLDLVPNLLRVARTLTMNRKSWQCATPKDDHRKHNTDAMRNVCGIRLVLVVGVRELLINSFLMQLV